MNLGTWDLAAGPKPSAVMVGLPPKKFAQPESTTRYTGSPARSASSLALSR